MMLYAKMRSVLYAGTRKFQEHDCFVRRYIPSMSWAKQSVVVGVCVFALTFALMPFGSRIAWASAGADPVPPAVETTSFDALGTAELGGEAIGFTLDNGMRAVVIPDRRAPIATHMVWYLAGAADEPWGKSGIAHFLEHLMFKGTANHPEGAFSKRVAEIGGVENAFTSQDYTAYFQTVAKEHLPDMMAFEADRMANLVLDQTAIVAERDVVLEERKMRVDNDPGARLAETVNATLHANHPYAVPVIGWADEIAQLTREDALAFYNRYYTPNNAILVVSGDVDPAEVARMAQETYGRVPRRAEPEPRRRPAQQSLPGARRIVFADPQVRQASMTRKWAVPGHTAPAASDDAARPSHALNVLSQILGGGPTSRLYQSLVSGTRALPGADAPQRLATSAGSYYIGMSVDQGSFAVYATPREEVSLDTVSDAVAAVVEDIAEHGVDEEEFARAKRQLVADAIFAQDSQRTMAQIFGASLATGGALQDVQHWPARIAAVSAADVQAAAQSLTQTSPVEGRLTPVAAP